MRKFLLLILITSLLCVPVSALEFTAPPTPEFAEQYMPESSSSFLSDLWYIIKKSFADFYPQIANAARICVTVIVIVMLISLMQNLSGAATRTVNLAGVIAISTTLLAQSGSLIRIGVETVESISEYGKLLLPTMTAALAAEGGVATSTALYTGTVIFNSILISTISKVLVPMLYAFIALSIAKAVIDEDILKNLQTFAKWLITWLLKISIYIFTGYLTVTGVVSGTIDAAAVKATKLAVSGVVPVVGSIISDASETILISAGIMKNTVGTCGVLAILAMWIGPFWQIGAQYLTLKITAAVAGTFGCKQSVLLIDSFSAAMGFLVAMTGTVCIMLLISTVCFMKGVG